MKIFFFPTFWALFHQGFGRLSADKCQSFPVMEGFEAQKYLGRWYEYSKYFALFEIFGTCTNAVYTDQTPEGSANIVIGVHNMGIDRMTGENDDIRGTAVLSDPQDKSRKANLIVNFDPVPIKQNTTNYSVVRTDYSSYAVVYACEDGPRNIEYLWVLTRKQFPEKALIQRIYGEITSHGFDTQHLWKTKQYDCPEFPNN